MGVPPLRKLLRRVLRWQVIAALAAGPVVAAVVLEAEVTHVGHQVTAAGFSAEEMETISRAVERYTEMGFDLPPVHLYRAEASCDYGGKLYNTFPVRFSQICYVSHRVVTHELAHAWINTTLTAAEMDEFTETRGAAAWRGDHLDWEDKGSEQAAEILTWYIYWSGSATMLDRIGGEVSPERFLADSLQLLAASSDKGPLLSYPERRDWISSRFLEARGVEISADTP